MDTARGALPDDITALKEALASERAKALDIAAELAQVLKTYRGRNWQTSMTSIPVAYPNCMPISSAFPAVPRASRAGRAYRADMTIGKQWKSARSPALKRLSQHFQSFDAAYPARTC
jgi:hypothetical protein